MTTEQNQKGLSTGAGIAVAGVLIAIAIFVTGGSASVPAPQDTQAGNSFLNQVAEDDHVYGNPDAPITLIEYSDFECPFCDRYHPVVEQIVANNPDVKWVYRHFPLSGHPNAFPAAIASECVAELGGNDKFWEFGSYLFVNQASLGDELYLSFVREHGIDEGAFTTCFENDTYADKINDDLLDGQLSGVAGTPGSILVAPSGQAIPFSGALPYETVQNLVDKLRG